MAQCTYEFKEKHKMFLGKDMDHPKITSTVSGMKTSWGGIGSKLHPTEYNLQGRFEDKAMKLYRQKHRRGKQVLRKAREPWSSVAHCQAH